MAGVSGDRFARLSLVVGLVTALLGRPLSYWQPARGEAVAILMYAMAGTLVTYWVLYEAYHWWRGRRGPSESDLRAQAAELSRQLYAFERERQQSRPDWVSFQPPRGATDVGRRAMWELWNVQSDLHSSETESIYEQQFRVRALTLYNAVVDAGLYPQPESEAFDRDRKYIRKCAGAKLEDIAAIFERIGRGLPREDPNQWANRGR